MELVREAPSRERRVSSASGTLAKRRVSRSLSGDGPDGSGGRGPEGGGAGIGIDEAEAELECRRRAGRLAKGAEAAEAGVIGDCGTPPRAETV